MLFLPSKKMEWKTQEITSLMKQFLELSIPQFTI